MLVMEAAGYDVVLVETVGVGQSEYVVAEMVDTFLFLTLARTGDQLQGMKRGILELADVIAVNKADGEHALDSRKAARELSGALRMLRGSSDDWQAPVVTCSALHNEGSDNVWRHVRRHRRLAGLPRRAGRQAPPASWSTGPARWSGTACCPASTRSRTWSPSRGGRPGRRAHPGPGATRILAALD
jgi:LAO/AO transport system kinase